MAEDQDPTVGNSDAQGDSQSSSESQQSGVDLTALQKRIDELEAKYRGVQKGSDKINARVEQRVAEVLSSAQIGRIAELAKAGKDSAEIERELLLEDLLAERKRVASGAQSGNERAEGRDEVGDIFSRTVTELNLDPNNAMVKDAISKKDFAAIVRLAVSKSEVPEPDATTQPPLTSKEKVSADANQKALQAAYDKELAELQRAANGRRVSPAALANLKVSYKRKGLNIH